MILNTSSSAGSEGNYFGRKVAKLRYQRGWTQDMFVAKIQIRFPNFNFTRDILANIETSRSPATHKHVFMFAHIFNVSIDELFRP